MIIYSKNTIDTEIKNMMANNTGVLLSKVLRDTPSADYKQLGSLPQEDENIDSSESEGEQQSRDGCKRMHGVMASYTDRITGKKNVNTVNCIECIPDLKKLNTH